MLVVGASGRVRGSWVRSTRRVDLAVSSTCHSSAVTEHQIDSGGCGLGDAEVTHVRVGVAVERDLLEVAEIAVGCASCALRANGAGLRGNAVYGRERAEGRTAVSAFYVRLEPAGTRRRVVGRRVNVGGVVQRDRNLRSAGVDPWVHRSPPRDDRYPGAPRRTPVRRPVN